MAEPASLPAAAAGSRTDGLQSLAADIASNLTQSREQEAPPASREEQPRASAPEPAPATVPDGDGPEPARELEQEPRTETEEASTTDDAGTEQEQPAQTTERFSIEDFSDAAGVQGEDFAERLYVTVKGPDGAPREVNLAELQNGYRWNAANTQKAQEVAEQRKALETRFAQVGEVQAQAEAVIQSQYAAVDAAEKRLNEQVQATDWQALQARGDGSYADARAWVTAQQSELANQRQTLDESKASISASRDQAREQYMSEVVPKARERLMELVPEWRDSARMEQEGAALGQYAVEMGFTEQEYSQCIDPRMLKLLRDAWQGQKLASQGREAVKKVAGTPKLTVAPGRRQTRQESQSRERDSLLERAVSSGKARDLAAVVRHNMTSRPRR